MAKDPLKILLLFDLGQAPPENQDYTEILKTEKDWEGEAKLVRALKNLGYEVRMFGLFDSIVPLFDVIHSYKPDLVFNQCEALRTDRNHEPHIVGLLQMLNVKYTGADPVALQICKDKGLTKKILSYHRIRIPQFAISKKTSPIRKLRKFSYPAFSKPLMLEGSVGISQVSFTENEKDTIDRVRFIHESLETDAIVEEYIEGRELYVGIIGNDRLKVFPPRELSFSEVPEGEPKFATFKAKWDDNYRKKWGIKSGPAKNLAPSLEKKISEVCKKIYKLCEIRGYARIDLRLTAKDEIVFIEANPNPSIAWDEDFALAAKEAGLDYEALIDQIIHLALQAS